MRTWICILFCSLLFSCQSNLQEYRLEGQAEVKALLELLKEVETREDLVILEPELRQSYEKLVAIMIRARQFQHKNPGAEVYHSRQSVALSDLLRDEIERVYGTIEGGREILERCSREAMVRLDASERLLERQKSQSSRIRD